MATPTRPAYEGIAADDALVTVLRETLVILKAALESLLEDSEAEDYGLGDAGRT